MQNPQEKCEILKISWKEEKWIQRLFKINDLL